MPFNLLKSYNLHLEIAAMNDTQRRYSLRGVFDRDFVNVENVRFRNKQITPTPADGVITMDTLFSHLTTTLVDRATNRREFDYYRACRLHWVRYHIDEIKQQNILVFSVDEPEGVRTYIYDIDEMYVVILEPKRNKTEYYLITAYHLSGKDAKRDKIIKKYKRRLDEIL